MLLDSTKLQTTISMTDKFIASLSRVSLRTHLLLSLIIRLLLIIYGQLHDSISEVPYTDIDYKVVTDGARQVLQGGTPFSRHTYRYTPLLAYIQIPNLILHPAIGKVIYSCFDLLVAIIIHRLVRAELQSQCRKAVQSLLSKFGKIRSMQSCKTTDEKNRPEIIACASACFWLYNPLTAVISTRGNGDSFSSFFVILTLYLLAKAEDAKHGKYWLIFAAGIVHGFAIHLRLYPLLFSLAYYLSLSEKLVSSLRVFLWQILFPSKKHLVLILGTLIGLLTTIGFFYSLYGWQYIHEAYLYHFIRKDLRHNFSLYFLMNYVSGDRGETHLFEKFLIVMPQILLLLHISFNFGQFHQTLPFCIFLLAYVGVTFNTVITSQYFIWYLALFPICLNNLQSIPLLKALTYFVIWLMGQGLWLLPAYFLEFKTWNTFYWIGVQGAMFFLINNFILVSLIDHYSFTSFKVNFKKLF